MEFKGVKQLILIFYSFQCTIFPVILSGLWGYHSHGADSKNLDFAAPLEEQRFYDIFCFFGFILKSSTPFIKCLKHPLKTISCSRSMCSGGIEYNVSCTFVADKNHNCKV